MRIGLDMDGVLANFNEPFRELLSITTGREIPRSHESDAEWPSVWNWPTAAGVSEEEVEAAFALLERTESEFWYSLPSCEGADDALRLLEAMVPHGLEVYYITARPGKTVKFWTEMWLGERGVEVPTVIPARNKGEVCRALQIDAFLDDKPQNCADILGHCAGLPTEVSLLARPYNRPAQEEFARTGQIRVVGSVEEWILEVGALV